MFKDRLVDRLEPSLGVCWLLCCDRVLGLVISDLVTLGQSILDRSQKELENLTYPNGIRKKQTSLQRSAVPYCIQHRSIVSSRLFGA